MSCLNKTVHRSHVSPEIFFTKLLGRTDIEDALKRLDSLIQEEVQMVIVQVLKIATEVEDGSQHYRLVGNLTLKARPPRCAADLK